MSKNIMRRCIVSLILVVFIFYSHGVEAVTEERVKKREPYKYVQAEVREWYSYGDSMWRISFFSPFWGRGESILEFNGIDAPVTLGTLRLKPGLYWLTLEGTYGTGDIDSGKTVDTDSYEDWLFGWSNWEDVWSESESDTDGDVTVIDTRMALRIYPWEENPRYYLDLTVGYIYFQERLHITNGYQTIPATGPFNGLNSTYDFMWESYPVGLRTKWNITQKVRPWLYNFYFSGSASAGPIRYKGEGVWNLRDDFEKDPSFRHEANEGFAIFVDINLNYQPIEYITLGVGYQYYHFEAQDGTDTTLFSDGTEGVADLDKVKSLRHGPYISLSGQF
jgi:hypothetical protein